VPIAQLAALARVWYAGRLDDAWNPPPRAERVRQLADHGFSGPFWRLP
jgi:hypothetical protein